MRRPGTATLAICLGALAACGGSDDTSTTADASLPIADAPAGGDGALGPDGTAALPDAPAATCTPVSGTPTLAAQEIARGLTNPIVIAIPPGDTRFFVAEKGGTIRIIEDGRPRATPFLDIHTKVSTGNEQGLLGMAFHPGYAQNGRFFVSFTNTGGQSRVWEYHVSADRNVAETQEKEILAVGQPRSNHNGGQVLFGPDGMLYVPYGDGGSQYDPDGNGQRLDTPLAKVLRIDVDHQDSGKNYAIPSDNPFVGTAGARGEIWVKGLRNPWRMSFDRQTGDAWIGDVGQDRFEEIDLVKAGQKGLNFGWGKVEGNGHCPSPPYTGTCSTDGETRPLLEWPHDDPDACNVSATCNAIVGGYVYRGCKMPDLRGAYFWSDNGCGVIKSVRESAPGTLTPHCGLTKSTPGTFGEDLEGEIVYCSLGEGRCYRIIPAP